MPVYEYLNRRTGETEVLYRPVARRDDVPRHLERITVPRRVGVVGLAEAPTQESGVLQGLKKCEERMGTSALVREFGPGWSAEKIKKVWRDKSYDVEG